MTYADYCADGKSPPAARFFATLDLINDQVDRARFLEGSMPDTEVTQIIRRFAMGEICAPFAVAPLERLVVFPEPLRRYNRRTYDLRKQLEDLGFRVEVYGAVERGDETCGVISLFEINLITDLNGPMENPSSRVQYEPQANRTMVWALD